MANVKISALPAATTPLDGTELTPIVQAGVTKRATTQDIANLAAAVALLKANNLSDLTNVPQARINLGLGTAATQSAAAFDAAGSAATAQTNSEAYTDAQIAAIPNGTNATKGKAQGDGKTVNINNGVASVKGNALYHPGFQAGRYYTFPGFSAGANTAIVANRLYALPFYLPYAQSFSEAMVSISAGIAASSGEIGIYANNNGVPDALEYDCGTISVAATGLISLTGLALNLDAGWHWLAFASNAAPSLRSTNANITTLTWFGFPPGNISAASETVYTAWAFAAGALPNPFGAVTYGGAGNQPLVFLKI